VDPMREFAQAKRKNIKGLGESKEARELAHRFMRETAPFRYTYHFEWLGRPILQLPQDIVALQEIIWRVRPDVVVETGIAHGGSLVLSASILELLGGDRRVIGIDVDIRPHNRIEIERHPLARRIEMIEGSSTDPEVVARVQQSARGARVVVILDSDHTHAHVLKELELYSPLVGLGSYLVVLDTVIDDMPEDLLSDRSWGPGNNPKTALREFLATNSRFEIDRDIGDKLLLTVAPEGYLRCVSE
jgi:cephalosporin hydroxylase